MIVECSECSAKNSVIEAPDVGKEYRCGKCGAVITFLQSTDAEHKENTVVEEDKPQRKPAQKPNVRDITNILMIMNGIVYFSYSLITTQQGYGEKFWVETFIGVVVVMVLTFITMFIATFLYFWRAKDQRSDTTDKNNEDENTSIWKRKIF